MSLRFRWTSDQDAQLLTAAADGATFAELGERFACSRDCARERYFVLLAAMRPSGRAAAKRAHDTNLRLPMRWTANAAQLADRDARARARPRDLAAAVFGDPPPGHSALDRRRAT